jgi:small subunit ribosomal protein S7
MPRKGSVPPRKIEPDLVYGSELVQRVINRVMQRGKKSLAEKIVYKALDIVREKTGKDPVEVLEKAIENLKPEVEVRPRRVGGATYQVPIPVREQRALSLAIRWLVTYARGPEGRLEQGYRRPERRMEERLAGEIIDAYNGTGGAMRRKEEMHRMAEANRAFAHYRW